jgi:hypothetical protein
MMNEIQRQEMRLKHQPINGQDLCTWCIAGRNGCDVTRVLDAWEESLAVLPTELN